MGPDRNILNNASQIMCFFLFLEHVVWHIEEKMWIYLMIVFSIFIDLGNTMGAQWYLMIPLFYMFKYIYQKLHVPSESSKHFVYSFKNMSYDIKMDESERCSN